MTMENGVDLQIKQRVLTKIRGSAEQLDGLLLDSDELLVRLFDEYNDLSSFEECRETIIQKKKELNNYGYCI